MLSRRDFSRLSLFTLGLGLTNCSRLSPQADLPVSKTLDNADLTIWWEQGFLPEENEQILQLVKAWETQSGRRVNLKLLPVDLINSQLSKVIEAPKSNNIPDIIYSVGIDASLAPKLAWYDRLMDLSEVITPLKNKYTSTALSQVSYLNKIRGERSYYALPLWQSDDYIHYWGSQVEEIGFAQQDIPREWDKFWKFWQTAQDRLRTQRNSKIYGVGLCMSAIGFDTYTSLMMFLDAHNVAVVNDTGQLLLEESENRQRFIEALTEYTNFYLQGYVPPVATQWTGSGNNTAFLDGEILMTQNLTLSIPLTQKLANNPYNQDALKRYQQIVTIDRPQKPDGSLLLTRKGIKQAIVPQTCPHPEAAKEFLTYLVDEENLNRLIKGFKGRILPVMPQLLKDPFWSDATDPHLSTALKIYAQPSLIPYEVIHSAFSKVQNQQTWAKTILKIIQDKASPQESADWAIAQIKEILKEW